MNAILIHPDYWRNSQLSIARFYGAIDINGTLYLLDGKTDYLVRKDFARFIGNLGFDTVVKAVKRYSDEDRAKKILKRLDRIVYRHKHQRKVVKDFDGQVREWELDFE